MRTSPGNCQWRHKVRGEAASHIAPTTFHIIAYFVGAAAADVTMASVASEAAALDIRKATTIEERIDTSPGSLAQLSP